MQGARELREVALFKISGGGTGGARICLTPRSAADGLVSGDRIAMRGAGCAAEGRPDESGELVGPGDPAAQARQVFENLRRCLAQAGAGFGDVVKLTFFVLDVADLPAVRAARDAVIDTARPPASTAVQVAALFAPGYVLEVEAWALVDD